MNGKLKVDLPAGYRWVKENEEQSGIWMYQYAGEWREFYSAQRCRSNWFYITPIEPPKPDTVDTPIEPVLGRYLIQDPNNDEYMCQLYDAPCIVGPEWAFAGFVWGDGSIGASYCNVYADGSIHYAVAVRFRRVSK